MIEWILFPWQEVDSVDQSIAILWFKCSIFLFCAFVDLIYWFTGCLVDKTVQVWNAGTRILQQT